jgi:hypothetical protein
MLPILATMLFSDWPNGAFVTRIERLTNALLRVVVFFSMFLIAISLAWNAIELVTLVAAKTNSLGKRLYHLPKLTKSGLEKLNISVDAMSGYYDIVWILAR